MTPKPKGKLVAKSIEGMLIYEIEKKPTLSRD